MSSDNDRSPFGVLPGESPPSFEDDDRPEYPGTVGQSCPQFFVPDREFFASMARQGGPLSKDQLASYLDELGIHGRKELAARAVGVSPETVERHLVEHDPLGLLRGAVALQLTLRSQRIVARLEREAVEGHSEPIVNKDGDVVGHKIKYETALRRAVLQRHDPAYSDKAEVHHTGEVQTGVLMVPSPVGGIDDWAAKVAAAKGEDKT